WSILPNWQILSLVCLQFGFVVYKAPAGGEERIVCSGLAPSGWLSVVGGEIGRLGRCQLFFSYSLIPYPLCDGSTNRSQHATDEMRLSDFRILSAL
ncbi:MAG: hypothetical protein JSV68_11590, partial [Anaerolineaceae bacterium]